MPGLWLGCSLSSPLHPCSGRPAASPVRPTSRRGAWQRAPRPAQTGPAPTEPARRPRAQAPAKWHLNPRPRKPSPKAAEWWGDSSHSAQDRDTLTSEQETELPQARLQPPRGSPEPTAPVSPLLLPGRSLTHSALWKRAATGPDGCCPPGDTCGQQPLRDPRTPGGPSTEKTRARALRKGWWPLPP